MLAGVLNLFVLLETAWSSQHNHSYIYQKIFIKNSYGKLKYKLMQYTALRNFPQFARKPSKSAVHV